MYYISVKHFQCREYLSRVDCSKKKAFRGRERETEEGRKKERLPVLLHVRRGRKGQQKCSDYVARKGSLGGLGEERGGWRDMNFLVSSLWKVETATSSKKKERRWKNNCLTTASRV